MCGTTGGAAGRGLVGGWHVQMGGWKLGCMDGAWGQLAAPKGWGQPLGGGANPLELWAAAPWYGGRVHSLWMQFGGCGLLGAVGNARWWGGKLPRCAWELGLSTSSCQHLHFLVLGTPVGTLPPSNASSPHSFRHISIDTTLQNGPASHATASSTQPSPWQQPCRWAWAWGSIHAACWAPPLVSQAAVPLKKRNVCSLVPRGTANSWGGTCQHAHRGWACNHAVGTSMQPPTRLWLLSQVCT